MPWEADGHRWHVIDRVTTSGAKPRWEGEIVDWIVDGVHELGDFSDTDWSQRTIVEIAGPRKSQGWFLHLHTGMEWLIRLVFRVARNAFREEDLIPKLGIRPLDETPGLEVYGSNERVHVANRKEPWQEVAILAHRLTEIDTPAFRAFLKQAVSSFGQTIARMNSKPEDVMPWKVNGQRWHLGEKGFPIGKRVVWDRSLLPRLIELVGESTQSGADRFGLSSVGKSPQKSSIVVIAQSAFFRLMRHGCKPFLLRATGRRSAVFRDRDSVAVGRSRTEISGCEYAW